VKWRRLANGKTYHDADRKFVIEFMAGAYWLARREADGSTVHLGKYRSCREARRAAEVHAARENAG
jgi:hypothetical protein